MLTRCLWSTSRLGSSKWDGWMSEAMKSRREKKGDNKYSNREGLQVWATTVNGGRAIKNNKSSFLLHKNQPIADTKSLKTAAIEDCWAWAGEIGKLAISATSFPVPVLVPVPSSSPKQEGYRTR